MLHKTRGIVFKVTDYAETSVVAKVYTELFGLQGYLINSVRKKNAKVKQNMLHPLALVDLVIYHKERKGLHRIADIRPNPVLQHATSDVKKSSIVFFLTEVLNKAVHEEEANPLLFDFIFNSVQILDQQNPLNSNFHLHFLIKLTKYLGFHPATDSSSMNKKYFNLKEGVFQDDIPDHPFYMGTPYTGILFQFLQNTIAFSEPVQMITAQKRNFTEKLLEYYRLHLPNFSAVQSLNILEMIWS